MRKNHFSHSLTDDDDGILREEAKKCILTK
jgi:hypothetical protein